MEERDTLARRVCEMQIDVVDTGQNGLVADGKETVNANRTGLLASYLISQLLGWFLPQTITKQPSQGQ
jgi:hypothetical protein